MSEQRTAPAGPAQEGTAPADTTAKGAAAAAPAAQPGADPATTGQNGGGRNGGAASRSSAAGGDKPAGGAQERTADITATQGGVMTDEAGVVTGELTLKFSMDEKLAVALTVQYKDAAEWYTVTNGRCQLADARDLDAVATLATGLLNRPQG